MSSTFGKNIKLTIFGESHGPAIGGVIEGLPMGMLIDEKKIDDGLKKRSPRGKQYVTKRIEEDKVIFLSGVVESDDCTIDSPDANRCKRVLKTNGAPLAFIIKNTHKNSNDYDSLSGMPRPGTADFPLMYKALYAGIDMDEVRRGGGHNSGRLTAPLVVAAAICEAALKEHEIEIFAELIRLGGEEDKEKWQQLLKDVKTSGDSVGGVVRCLIKNPPLGMGKPMMDTLEGLLSHMMFSIPGMKAISFGEGIEVADMLGSDANDSLHITDNGIISFLSNKQGGILGGRSSGQDIFFDCYFKPTPSIGKTQKTINLGNMKNEDITIKGRHDVAYVLRVPEVVRAASIFVITDLLMEE